MSEYGAITPTTNGLTMITESVVKKKPIVFTKIAIGDGALTNQNIETLTALIRQKQEAPIHIVTDKGAGLADVSAVITNVGLSTGYYARELGVFAKVGDTGQEKLFAYTNAGANASYSPADGSLDEKLITVTFKIGTGATLKVALNSQVYLTLGNLEEHNTSSSAHADIRRMFNNYLPLTGGTVSGRTHIDSMLSVGQSSGVASNIRVDGAAGNAYIALLNYNNTNSLLIDGYFNNPETAAIDVTNRDKNGTVRYRSTLMDGKGNAKFANEVYANEKLLATKEYVDTHNTSSSAHADIRAKITSDINAHNISNSAHADIRAKITSDINAHNISNSAHADIRRMFNNYLPLTGGTVSGRTHIDSMLSVGQSSGVASNIRVDGAAGNAYIALLNYNNTNSLLIDGYFNNPETAAIDVTNRDKNGTVRYRSTLMDGKGNAKFANEVYANEKLLATKEYVDTHNTSSSAHNDIRQLFKWKKLYSVNRAAFVMPASGTALCDIPSTWKELHITWIWTNQTSTINNVVGHYSYTANIINEAIADPIIFVFPGSEGYLVVKNNKLYVIHRGDNDDGAPVLIMWR